MILFYNKDLLKNNQLAVIQSKYSLKTKAIFNLSSGLFIDFLKYNQPKMDTSGFSENCGSNYNIFVKAQFEQYFHNINKNFKIQNIPLAFDVTGENYTQDDYNRNASKFHPNELVSDCFQITECPGKTVSSKPELNLINMKNPGNKNGKLRKENVGINSRIGFTYGKFIARIKFPPVISRDNVWNGLTCAYWLKFQDENDWNNRCNCDSVGYLSKGYDGPESPRLKTTFYSEIDYEILKTTEYWPATSYPKNSNVPKDDPKSNHNIIVTCTNWDLACKQPVNFSIGAKDFFTGEKHYTVHRWDDWYKALTIKTEINHDSVFNRPYYFEIDWQPDKIIWRIGSSRDKLIEVGYMNQNITSIPDNQMVAVFTQEFHDAKWWPLSPFIQDMIPYPKNDINGQILELEVE